MHLMALAAVLLSIIPFLNLCLTSAHDSYTVQVGMLQSDCGILYTVVVGDSCFAIADKAKITTAQLTALNPKLNCTTIAAGDGLCLGVPCGTTYAVQSGDWCAEIASDHGTTQDVLATLNPGLSCADLFTGQVLCVAPPTALPPSPDPVPAPPPDGMPTVACRTFLPVSLNNTCNGLANEWGIQHSQFSSMNGHLNCSSLQPGTIACVFPACEQFYKVQQGDSCFQIERDIGLSSGQLTILNPGLACSSLFPNQNLCVEPPAEKLSDDPGTFSAWKKYPALSSGDLPKSPLVSFVRANDSRETFFGDVVSRLDSQHREVFNRVDLNKDGKLDRSELETLYATYPHTGNGIAELDDTITQTNFVERMIKSADTNGDGVIDESEYMSAVFSAQNATTASSDIAFRARATNDLSLHQKRYAPLLTYALIDSLAMLAAVNFAEMMAALEMKSRADAGDLLKYLDVTFWDRKNEPEPKCAAYMYYSSSCAALGNSWSSHCSEGGEKVYDESCRGLITHGSKACGFLGCSSLCYKINTENCDCDALKYTTETHRDYADPPASESQETGVGGCRNKCRGLNGCVGFTVSVGNDDTHITCKVFTSMKVPQSNDKTVAFMLTGPPVGSETNPICPRIPDGYYPISADQMAENERIGQQLSDQYSNYLGGSSEPKEPYDPRGTYAMYVKDQGDTGTCASHAFSTMVEGSIQKQYNRKTSVKPVSPAWIHHCRLWLDKRTGTNFIELEHHISSSYIASEDCMQMKDWLDRDRPNCDRNGCAQSQYGSLPYVTKYWEFTSPQMKEETPQRALDHIRNVGPLFMAFSLPNEFNQYAIDLHRGNIPKDEVFYDGHPRYKAAHHCQYGGHAMTAVGYAYHTRQSETKLYWIIQNSWGTGSGDNGFVYIEYASLCSALVAPRGINVREGTQWLSNDIPPGSKHDEL